MAEWTEITVAVATADMETAEAVAQMTVPYGIYTEDYSALEQEVRNIARVDLIDEELLKKDRNKALIHVYINPEENPAEAAAFLSERLNDENIEHTVSTAGCEEQDWLDGWRKYFNPIEVGKKLLIRPTWRDNYDAQGRIVLNIDPGIAFGTGGHETTRLCLEAIENHLSGGESVLDVGCGSGILSVGAVLLGADNATAVDIDPMAVKTAHENAALNCVEDKINIICGDLTEGVSGKYDIIVANIVADAIIELSRSIADFMKPNAVYIMSGIIDTRLEQVLGALENDFCVKEVVQDNCWACIIASKK